MYGLPPDSVLLIDRAMYGRQVLRRRSHHQFLSCTARVEALVFTDAARRAPSTRGARAARARAISAPAHSWYSNFLTSSTGLVSVL